MLLQKMVDTDLQIPVQGQVDIISRHRLRGVVEDLEHMAHAVHIHVGDALFSLEHMLHGSLNADTPHRVVQFVILIPLSQLRQLFLALDLSRVADYWSEIQGILVDSYGRLGNVHTLKLRHMFRDIRHSLL